MRLHETWTGAANPGDRTFSVASVEGVSFTVSQKWISLKPFLDLEKVKRAMYYKHHLCLKFQAYASGCNIVILSSKFNRVQIIPGVCHDNIQISCLDCSVDSGRIAAAYANEVVIFEPTPLLRPSIEENYKSRWMTSFPLT